ncbi:DUF6308 family protein [Jatrophihabitans fulvus]
MAEHQYDRQFEILDEAATSRRNQSIGALSAYFAPNRFTGAWFNSFRADANEENAHAITSDDLVAVSMLSVQVPPAAAYRILVDDAAAVETLLRRIPQHAIYEVGEPTRSEWWEAGNELWRLLQRNVDTFDRGVGWVTAGKLLARKRPHLIPVYDSVVKASLGAPRSIWTCMWEYFAGNPDRQGLWTSLRDDSGARADLSVLRTIDVVLWMRGQDI